MKIQSFLLRGVLLAVAASGSARAAGFAITQVDLQFEAGSGLYKQWSGGGTTWHSGIGFIQPYGPATYACGVGYAESKNFPMPAYVAELVKQHSIDTNPLFCIYRLKNGDIYTYDVWVGTMTQQEDAAGTGRRDSVINVVAGGTGAFKNASGVWVGVTQGRGELSPVASGQKLPTSILKLMNGYVRIPAP